MQYFICVYYKWRENILYIIKYSIMEYIYLYISGPHLLFFFEPIKC